MEKLNVFQFIDESKNNEQTEDDNLTQGFKAEIKDPATFMENERNR